MPPEVKITSSGSALMSAATCARARSIASRFSWPKKWRLDALPKRSLKIREHGVDDLLPQVGRRVVIEIDAPLSDSCLAAIAPLLYTMTHERLRCKNCSRRSGRRPAIALAPTAATRCGAYSTIVIVLILSPFLIFCTISIPWITFPKSVYSLFMRGRCFLQM